jgi:hypothetical protein
MNVRDYPFKAVGDSVTIFAGQLRPVAPPAFREAGELDYSPTIDVLGW